MKSVRSFHRARGAIRGVRERNDAKRHLVRMQDGIREMPEAVLDAPAVQ